MTSITLAWERDELALDANDVERLTLLVAKRVLQLPGQEDATSMLNEYLVARRLQSVLPAAANQISGKGVPFLIALENDCYSPLDLSLIADRIVDQLISNREGEGHTRLRYETGRVRRRLARARSDIALNALGMNLCWFADEENPSRRNLWAELTVLDDLLETYTVRERLDGRRGSSRFRRYVAAQKKRRAALDRVEKKGGILEIDLMAEYAIVESGHTVGQIVNMMQENRDKRHSVVEAIRLSFDPLDDEISVYVRDGRIELDFCVGSVRTMRPGLLEVEQIWPTTVTVGMANQHLCQIIGHPLLKPDAMIIHMTTDDECSYVEIQQQYRVVQLNEACPSENLDDLPF